MFNKRSSKKELVDDLALDDPALTQNLQELEAVNRWLGGRTALISALSNVCRRQSSLLKGATITPADLGCGGVDLPTAVHAWTKEKHLIVGLIGLDGNPCMVGGT